MLDNTDLAIIRLLAEDSRRQWKDIGAKVHLTGQAVAARVRALEEDGVIDGFTVRLNPAKLGKALAAMITVYMNSPNHEAFRQFLSQEPLVTEAHRISGEGCYWLRAEVASHDELNTLLERILRYGNYRVNLSIGKVK